MTIDLTQDYDFHMLTDHLTQEEKAIWYNGFEKALSLYFQASDKVTGVFRLPEEKDQLMTIILEKVNDQIEKEICVCADVPCGNCKKGGNDV